MSQKETYEEENPGSDMCVSWDARALTLGWTRENHPLTGVPSWVTGRMSVGHEEIWNLFRSEALSEVKWMYDDKSAHYYHVDYSD